MYVQSNLVGTCNANAMLRSQLVLAVHWHALLGWLDGQGFTKLFCTVSGDHAAETELGKYSRW